mgnify:CR=1 FL=1
MGLIPIFPGGANVTGNIAITMVLALFDICCRQPVRNETYWKDIFGRTCALVVEGSCTDDAFY